MAVLDDGNGSVKGLRCVRMELGEPDASGRRRPVPVAGSEFDFECDLVVYAIGTNANPIMGQTSGLRLNPRGYIDADETLATSLAGVFAGGDIVTGAATVIKAMGAGRHAAASMKAYLRLRDTRRPYHDSGETLFGIDAGEGAVLGGADDDPAPLVDRAEYVALELGGAFHRDLHDGFEDAGPRLAVGFAERADSSKLERDV